MKIPMMIRNLFAKVTFDAPAGTAWFKDELVDIKTSKPLQRDSRTRMYVLPDGKLFDGSTGKTHDPKEFKKVEIKAPASPAVVQKTQEKHEEKAWQQTLQQDSGDFSKAIDKVFKEDRVEAVIEFTADFDNHDPRSPAQSTKTVKPGETPKERIDPNFKWLTYTASFHAKQHIKEEGDYQLYYEFHCPMNSDGTLISGKIDSDLVIATPSGDLIKDISVTDPLRKKADALVHKESAELSKDEDQLYTKHLTGHGVIPEWTFPVRFVNKKTGKIYFGHDKFMEMFSGILVEDVPFKSRLREKLERGKHKELRRQQRHDVPSTVEEKLTVQRAEIQDMIFELEDKMKATKDKEEKKAYRKRIKELQGIMMGDDVKAINDVFLKKDLEHGELAEGLGKEIGDYVHVKAVEEFLHFLQDRKHVTVDPVKKEELQDKIDEMKEYLADPESIEDDFDQILHEKRKLEDKAKVEDKALAAEAAKTLKPVLSTLKYAVAFPEVGSISNANAAGAKELVDLLSSFGTMERGEIVVPKKSKLSGYVTKSDFLIAIRGFRKALLEQAKVAIEDLKDIKGKGSRSKKQQELQGIMTTLENTSKKIHELFPKFKEDLKVRVEYYKGKFPSEFALLEEAKKGHTVAWYDSESEVKDLIEDATHELGMGLKEINKRNKEIGKKPNVGSFNNSIGEEAFRDLGSYLGVLRESLVHSANQLVDAKPAANYEETRAKLLADNAAKTARIKVIADEVRNSLGKKIADAQEEFKDKDLTAEEKKDMGELEEALSSIKKMGTDIKGRFYAATSKFVEEKKKSQEAYTKHLEHMKKEKGDLNEWSKERRTGVANWSDLLMDAKAKKLDKELEEKILTGIAGETKVLGRYFVTENNFNSYKEQFEKVTVDVTSLLEKLRSALQRVKEPTPKVTNKLKALDRSHANLVKLVGKLKAMKDFDREAVADLMEDIQAELSIIQKEIAIKEEREYTNLTQMKMPADTPRLIHDPSVYKELPATWEEYNSLRMTDSWWMTHIANELEYFKYLYSIYASLPEIRSFMHAKMYPNPNMAKSAADALETAQEESVPMHTRLDIQRAAGLLAGTPLVAEKTIRTHARTLFELVGKGAKPIYTDLLKKRSAYDYKTLMAVEIEAAKKKKKTMEKLLQEIEEKDKELYEKFYGKPKDEGEKLKLFMEDIKEIRKMRDEGKKLTPKNRQILQAISDLGETSIKYEDIKDLPEDDPQVLEFLDQIEEPSRIKGPGKFTERGIPRKSQPGVLKTYAIPEPLKAEAQKVIKEVEDSELLSLQGLASKAQDEFDKIEKDIEGAFDKDKWSDKVPDVAEKKGITEEQAIEQLYASQESWAKAVINGFVNKWLDTLSKAKEEEKNKGKEPREEPDHVFMKELIRDKLKTELANQKAAEQPAIFNPKLESSESMAVHDKYLSMMWLSDKPPTPDEAVDLYKQEFGKYGQGGGESSSGKNRSKPEKLQPINTLWQSQQHKLADKLVSDEKAGKIVSDFLGVCIANIKDAMKSGYVSEETIVDQLVKFLLNFPNMIISLNVGPGTRSLFNPGRLRKYSEGSHIYFDGSPVDVQAAVEKLVEKIISIYNIVDVYVKPSHVPFIPASLKGQKDSEGNYPGLSKIQTGKKYLPAGITTWSDATRADRDKQEGIAPAEKGPVKYTPEFLKDWQDVVRGKILRTPWVHGEPKESEYKKLKKLHPEWSGVSDTQKDLKDLAEKMKSKSWVPGYSGLPTSKSSFDISDITYDFPSQMSKNVLSRVAGLDLSDDDYEALIS